MFLQGASLLRFVLAPIALNLIVVGVAAAQPPSLTETLEWMDSTYNSHRVTGGSFGHGIREEANGGKPFRRETESFAYKGCEMTLTFRDDPSLPSKEMITDHTDTFNLGDIDPSSIKIFQYDSQHGGLNCGISPQTMTCNMEIIEFQTRNQKPRIRTSSHAVFPKLRGRDHESKSSSTSFVSAFYLDDVEYGKRFETAFRHAVALCGGKPSTF